MLIRSLSTHARYRCGNSGECCSAGWAIAVEPPQETLIRGAITARRLGRGRDADTLLPAAHGLPDGARVVLGFDGTGRCLFHETDRGNLCEVHRVLGHEHLPLACRQFPRISLLTPHGVSVTLSHYCPTAAGLLFEDRPLRVVDDPPAFPPQSEYVGLDARTALPPMLRPDVFTDWDSYRAFEEWMVGTLADTALRPEQALDAMAARAEALRAWTPDAGAFAAHTARVLAHPVVPDTAAPWTLDEPALALADTVARSIAPAVEVVSHPPELGAWDATYVAAAWPALHAPMRRWLAARAFGSWCALQGQGLRTTVRAVRAAWAVLRLHAARACADAGRSLDRPLLLQAIRESDLLLCHLVKPEHLARRLSASERGV